MTKIELDGDPVAIKVEAHGVGPTFDQDWIYFRSEDPVSPGASILKTDFDTPPGVGDKVYALGYRWDDRKGNDEDLTILPCLVNTPPFPIPSRTFAIQPATSTMCHGMSGGPIVMIRDGHPVVVGIIEGHGEITDDVSTRLILGIRPDLDIPQPEGPHGQ